MPVHWLNIFREKLPTCIADNIQNTFIQQTLIGGGTQSCRSTQTLQRDPWSHIITFTSFNVCSHVVCIDLYFPCLYFYPYTCNTSAGNHLVEIGGPQEKKCRYVRTLTSFATECHSFDYLTLMTNKKGSKVLFPMHWYLNVAMQMHR